jgi:predicted Zn-dependent peptidase
LEADRMRTLAVTPENVENQRQTVMEERRQRVDDAPYGQASVRIGELSYRCFAYAHPVIGYWDDLHAATLDDVVAFHARWYRPDNAVLALTGDLDPDEAIAQVEALFGDIAPGGPRPSPDLGEPLRTSAVKERITDPLARLPAVMVNHLAPDFDHPDFYTYELIETLLFQGTSSRVHRRIVLEEAAAVQVSGGYDCHRGPSSFGLFAAVAAGGDLDRVVALYQEELDRIATEPVPDREIEKALNQLRSGRVFGLENVLGRALQLGRSVLYHQDAAWEERYLDRVAAVTRADILRVAARDFSAPRVELQVVPA